MSAEHPAGSEIARWPHAQEPDPIDSEPHLRWNPYEQDPYHPDPYAPR